MLGRRRWRRAAGRPEPISRSSSSWSTSATPATPAPCCGPPTPPASSAVIFSGESVDPYNPKTVRASAGSLFHVPFSVQADPVALATSLAGAGLPHPGHRGAGRRRLRRTRLVGPDRAVPGERGGRPGARGAARPSAARWPSRWRVGPSPSTSGVACAVLCFEALRQRRSSGAGCLAGIYHFDVSDRRLMRH